MRHHRRAYTKSELQEIERRYLASLAPPVPPAANPTIDAVFAVELRAMFAELPHRKGLVPWIERCLPDTSRVLFQEIPAAVEHAALFQDTHELAMRAIQFADVWQAALDLSFFCWPLVRPVPHTAPSRPYQPEILPEPPPKPPRPFTRLRPAGVCWHCFGERVCRCIACDSEICTVCK